MVTKTSVQIPNSYIITSKEEMTDIINKNRNASDSQVYSRSTSSLVYEWASHNLLYEMHLFREHTADVDFEYPINKALEICYYIFGSLYFAWKHIAKTF